MQSRPWRRWVWLPNTQNPCNDPEAYRNTQSAMDSYAYRYRLLPGQTPCLGWQASDSAASEQAGSAQATTERQRAQAQQFRRFSVSAVSIWQEAW